MIASCWEGQFPIPLVSFALSQDISYSDKKDCTSLGGCAGWTGPSFRGIPQTPSLVVYSWGYKLELKSSLHTVWQATCPVCDSLPKENNMWVSKGLALIKSKGDVFTSTCSLLIVAKLRWRKEDVMNWCSEHPNTAVKAPGEYRLRLCTVARMVLPL